MQTYNVKTSDDFRKGGRFRWAKASVKDSNVGIQRSGELLEITSSSQVMELRTHPNDK
jgi:hypothetical protein